MEDKPIEGEVIAPTPPAPEVIQAQLRPGQKGYRIPRESKLSTIPRFRDFVNAYEAVLPQIRNGDLTLTKFWREILPQFLPPGLTVSQVAFQNWHNKYLRTEKSRITGGTLLEREQSKRELQIHIRQETTDLMSKFIQMVKMLVTNIKPERLKDLRDSGVNIKDLYKLIREEEDRQKGLELKERSEDRADAQFAFLVSVARAGVLTDDDIEFLELDTKAELIDLKKEYGVYRLPSRRQADVAQVEPATENYPAVATQGH